MFNKLPPELSTTFEKMIHQLDIIAKTMNIMDKRIATVENQISDLFKISKQKKNILETEESYHNSYRPEYQVQLKENQQENNYNNNIYGSSGIGSYLNQMHVNS